MHRPRPGPRRRVLITFSVTVVALITLVQGTIASADTASDQREVKRKRAEVASQVDTLKANDSQLEQALADLAANVRVTQAQMSDAQAEADAAEARAEQAETQAAATGAQSYNEILPLMMARYLGPGLLGLGVTALIAGFMSGMAGNVTAFSTVWTYDIYRPLHFAVKKKDATDKHYLKMGRWATFIGVLISIGTAYLVENAASIMDYVQALFSFFIAPLFGTVILAMLWKRTTGAGGFWG